ncbi:unnamed protein product, partial [Dicrocoelium dendriticum]
IVQALYWQENVPSVVESPPVKRYVEEVLLGKLDSVVHAAEELYQCKILIDLSGRGTVCLVLLSKRRTIPWMRVAVPVTDSGEKGNEQRQPHRQKKGMHLECSQSIAAMPELLYPYACNCYLNIAYTRIS